jgi:PKD repeat protein
MRKSGFWLAFLFILCTGNSCYKNEPVPTAEFNYAGSNQFYAPCSVSFLNQSLNAFSYEWDLAEGYTSVEVNPIRYFSKPGSYPVSLRSYTESRKEWASTLKTIIIKDTTSHQ